MSVEALLGTDVAFAAAYHAARPHPASHSVAAELRYLAADSDLEDPTTRKAHKVQDPYSIRWFPRYTAQPSTP